MGTDREINNLLNEFLQLETDEQRRQFQGKIAHTLSGKTEEEKREFAEILSNKAQQTIDPVSYTHLTLPTTERV